MGKLRARIFWTRKKPQRGVLQLAAKPSFEFSLLSWAADKPFSGDKKSEIGAEVTSKGNFFDFSLGADPHHRFRNRVSTNDSARLKTEKTAAQNHF